MSLTMGTGPLSRRPAGTFNFHPEPPGSALYLEPLPYRLRAEVAGVTVLDARRPWLLHETGHLPVFYVDDADLRADLLEPSPTTTRCPYKGEASYRTLRVGDRVVEDAVWTYADPLPAAPFLAGRSALYFRKADRWLVEDEVLAGHPRDPYHRIDVLATSRPVRISLDGRVLAESERALMLVETGLPPRFYLPAEDVRADVLAPSATTTVCAYKGVASYRSVVLDGRREDDLVWCYEEPAAEVGRIAGRLCFFDERVDVEVDGVRRERPETPWSR